MEGERPWSTPPYLAQPTPLRGEGRDMADPRVESSLHLCISLPAFFPGAALSVPPDPCPAVLASDFWLSGLGESQRI